MIKKNYEIIGDDEGIKCLRCGLTSYNSGDAINRYCANCKIFHDDPCIITDFEKHIKETRRFEKIAIYKSILIILIGWFALFYLKYFTNNILVSVLLGVLSWILITPATLWWYGYFKNKQHEIK